MKKLNYYFILLFVILFGQTNAQMDWIDFVNNGENGQIPEVDCYSDSSISIEFYGVFRYNRNNGDSIYDVLKLPGNNAKTEDFGYPLLPAKTCYIELLVDTPSITINSKEFIIIDNFNLWPAQDEKEMWEGAPEIPFEKNDSIYNLNQFYPENIVKIRLPKIMRGHKIASLAFFPVQFNPVTKQLKVFKNIDVTVHGAGSIETDKDNVHFDSFFENLVINYVPSELKDDIIDLMIITPNEYYNTLLPLKEWKEQAGIRTSIVTRSDVENAGYQWIADPTELDWIYEGIDAYIKNVYDTSGSLVPEYLLLIGETDTLTPSMPTHYWFSAGQPGYGDVPADLYYTTMDLNEEPYFPGILDLPDIHGGRISVDNVEELSVVIDKIINYEKKPYLEVTEWYETLNLSAYCQWYISEGTGSGCTEECNCFDEYYWIYTSWDLNQYFVNNTNYNVESVYFNDFYVYHPGEILCWDWGEEFPSNIPFIDEMNLATTAVIDDINNGCFIINHRDHGESRNRYSFWNDGWSIPTFDHNHISMLNNGRKLPVMFSINCQTGWFDGATDNNFNQQGNFDCFGELLLSKENGGIVGFIGASRNSRSGYSDELSKGFFDAIWQDFDPYFSNNQTPIYNLGAIKNYGLLFMYDKFILGNTTVEYNQGLYVDQPIYTRRQFEVFNVFGDPTLEIWTGVPQPLYALVDYEQNSVTIYNDNDELIPEAKVVLQHEGDYQVMMTDANGQVTSALLANYDVEVSALKHNYIPWYTEVVSSNKDWPSNEDVRGNIVVTNGSTLSITSDIEIPKYTQIIVMEGATLDIKFNTNVDFNNQYCGIISFGNLTIGAGAEISMTGIGTDPANIQLLDGSIDYSFSDVSFTKCNLTGIPKSLNIANGSSFSYGGIEIEKANVSITASNFTNAGFSASHASNKSGFVYITDECVFYNATTAISIDGYPVYRILDCTIYNCGEGIRIFNSGEVKGSKRIANNNIYSNSHVGIMIYHSYSDILLNNIYDNWVGVQSLDRSNTLLTGNSNAHDPTETQQIIDNDEQEVFATQGSFPYIFNWNAIIDDDNSNENDPLVEYSTILVESVDVANNFWGNNFKAEYDLMPYELFTYLPLWDLSYSESSEGAESMYNDAQDKIAEEDYAGAKIELQQIVTEYPTSKFAQAALRELYSLEEYATDDYSSLKNYYDTETVIQNNPDLAKLAEYLANFCEIKLENYPTAIAWFENVIQNPETIDDSIFAIIDLGYTYFIMENGGYKSAYSGKMIEHIPVSKKQFEDKRDYLLSLLYKDSQKNEEFDQELRSLKANALMQNMPNPFNGVTDIYYKLDKDATVGIHIYDYSGRKVKTINGKGIKGLNKVQFNSSGFPPGIYFYNLEINGNLSDSKKMTIIK